jgi:hypothetical protein
MGWNNHWKKNYVHINIFHQRLDVDIVAQFNKVTPSGMISESFIHVLIVVQLIMWQFFPFRPTVPELGTVIHQNHTSEKLHPQSSALQVHKPVRAVAHGCPAVGDLQLRASDDGSHYNPQLTRFSCSTYPLFQSTSEFKHSTTSENRTESRLSDRSDY